MRHVTREVIEAQTESTVTQIGSIIDAGKTEIVTYRAVLAKLSIHALMTGQTELSAKIQEVTSSFMAE